MSDFKYPNIASALAAFQKDIPVPTKDATADMGKFKNKYATLDNITPQILSKLSDVGIAYTAAPDLTELGFGLRAQLLHESGESITGFYPLGSPTLPAQAIGSAITYARRYALLALTGVAPTGEDDDGAAATQVQSAVNAQAAKAAAPKVAGIDEVRAQIGAIIADENSPYDGGIVNALASSITGKTPAEWGGDVAALRKVLAAMQNGELPA